MQTHTDTHMRAQANTINLRSPLFVFHSKSHLSCTHIQIAAYLITLPLSSICAIESDEDTQAHNHTQTWISTA